MISASVAVEGNGSYNKGRRYIDQRVVLRWLCKKLGMVASWIHGSRKDM